MNHKTYFIYNSQMLLRVLSVSVFQMLFMSWLKMWQHKECSQFFTPVV
jgi:hypothetical protein